METTSYGEAWRAFRKQNFDLCLTTYYSTVPITCTQTRIHRTQSLPYDKLLKRSSLRHIVITNFAATIYRGMMLARCEVRQSFFVLFLYFSQKPGYLCKKELYTERKSCE